jgi:hypothetical protein
MTHGSEAEFNALLSYLNSKGDTTETVEYNYPYPFTELQAKELGNWWMVGRNKFRIVRWQTIIYGV